MNTKVTYYNTTEAAAELNCSMTKINHLIKEQELDAVAQTRNGRPLFSIDDLQKLKTLEGTAIKINDLSSSEGIVLFVLYQRLSGFPSARSISRAAVLAVASVTKALSSLETKGFIVYEDNRWTINPSPELDKILAKLREGITLSSKSSLFKRPTNIPKNLKHLFWDIDFDKLNPDTSYIYVIRRLLERNYPGGVGWLTAYYSSEHIKETLEKTRYLDKKDRKYGEVLAGIA
jgi:DNA-binding MarR family transcriptional regulator